MTLGMTYGDEQVGLEFRNALCGLPDEFMDVIVSGPQVWWSLCHPIVTWLDGVFGNRRSA